MIAVPLIHAQLIPPRIKNLIQRNRLQTLGQAMLSYRVTTVVAPAGYGKSVWVSSLLDEAQWPATAWLSLDRHDSEPSFLMCHLIYAIRKVFPEFGQHSLRTLNSVEDVGRDWMIVVSTLLEEIPLETELMLILDDLHLIDQNPIVCSILEYLVRWLPDGVRIVFISRTRPAIALTREQLKGEVLEITSRDLLFSTAEVGELFSQMGLNLKAKDIELIHSKAEGWAVGLRLLAMYLVQSGDSVANTLMTISRRNTDLYTYFGNELLLYLSEEQRGFLLDSSLLPYLEPALCDVVLQCENSSKFLEMLHSQGLLTQEEGETVTWRLHHLMGDFLRGKVRQGRSTEYIAKLKKRAASYLEQLGDIDRALEQLVDCEDWAAAVHLLTKHGDQYYLERGRLDGLRSFIACLPSDYLESNPWLLYLSAMCLIHTNQTMAIRYLSQSIDLAEQLGETRCQIRALFAVISVHTFANNVRMVQETASRIPDAAALLGDSWSRGMALCAAFSQAAWEDDLQQGLLLYLAFSCMIQFRLGNLETAEEIMQKLVSDAYVQDNERWLGEALTIYTVLCALNGNKERMLEVSSELLRLGIKYNSLHQLGFAHRGLAYLQRCNNELSIARQEYTLSRNAFMQSNNLFMVYLTDLELILLRISLGENASTLLSDAQGLLSKLTASFGGRGLEDYALTLTGIIAMEAYELDVAQQYLEEVTCRSKRKGARQMLAYAQMYSARLALLQGDERKADRYLLEAIGAAEAEKWNCYGEWQTDAFYMLCRRALLDEIHPGVVCFLKRWFPQLVSTEAGSLLVSSNERVQQEIASIVRVIANQTGVPIIHLVALGSFRLFVNGKEITSGQWKTRKVEKLFKLLLIDRRQHPKERVIEQLWPEADSKLGDASLRMALSSLRKTLIIEEYAKDIVVLKRGVVYIQPELQVYTDYELFSSLASKAFCENQHRSMQSELLEQAVAVYQGELLPGDLYDDWIEPLRIQLSNLYLRVLLKQVECYRALGKLELALQACEGYLEQEPADETATCAAMELLCENGQPQQALDMFHRLSKNLLEHYNVTPSKKTAAFYEEIKAMKRLLL